MAGVSVEGVSRPDELSGEENAGVIRQGDARGGGIADDGDKVGSQSKLARWRGNIQRIRSRDTGTGAERAWGQGHGRAQRGADPEKHEVGLHEGVNTRWSGGSGVELAGRAISPSRADGDGYVGRAAKLAYWRQWRCSAAAHDSDGRCKNELVPPAGTGVDLGSSEEFVKEALPGGEWKRKTEVVWRHSLPDLKEMGIDFKVGHNTLFVLRVFARLPPECSGHARDGLLSAPQIVEVFTNIL